MRDGDDLIYRLDVTMIDAALGTTVGIPALDGDIELTLPAGTQPGEVKTYRNRGVPVLQGYGRGDLKVVVNVDRAAPPHGRAARAARALRGADDGQELRGRRELLRQGEGRLPPVRRPRLSPPTRATPCGRDRPAADSDASSTKATCALRAALRAISASAGWQESDDAGELVFWLPDGAGEGPGAREALARLGALRRPRARAPSSPAGKTRWRRFHQPVAVGELWIRPPWHDAARRLSSTSSSTSAWPSAPARTRRHASASRRSARCRAARCSTWAPARACWPWPRCASGSRRSTRSTSTRSPIAAADANARRNEPRADLHRRRRRAIPALALPHTDVVVANLALAAHPGARRAVSPPAKRPRSGGDSSPGGSADPAALPPSPAARRPARVAGGRGRGRLPGVRAARTPAPRRVDRSLHLVMPA